VGSKPSSISQNSEGTVIVGFPEGRLGSLARFTKVTAYASESVSSVDGTTGERWVLSALFTGDLQLVSAVSNGANSSGNSSSSRNAAPTSLRFGASIDVASWPLVQDQTGAGSELITAVLGAPGNAGGVGAFWVAAGIRPVGDPSIASAIQNELG
jgi:hypothetical protein